MSKGLYKSYNFSNLSLKDTDLIFSINLYGLGI
jgi:hypothetical protein